MIQAPIFFDFHVFFRNLICKYGIFTCLYILRKVTLCSSYKTKDLNIRKYRNLQVVALRQKTKDKVGRSITGVLGGLTGLMMSDINLGGLAGRLGADPMTQLSILGNQGMVKASYMNVKYGLLDLLGYDPMSSAIGHMGEASSIAQWATQGMDALIANMSGGATLESLLGTGGYIIPIAKAAACVGVGALAGVGAYYAGKYAYKTGKKIYDMCRSNKRKYRAHCDYVPSV